MKEIGIPDANYITFAGFRYDYVNGEFKQALPNSDIPHYNLITMNGLQNIPYADDPQKYVKLAENVKDQIKGIMEYNFNKDANGRISKDTTASIDGLYLIECLGDNYTFQGLFKYKKGERIWKYFEGEYERTSGWVVVEPLNILNVVLETDTKWKQGEIASTYGLYIVAYAFQDCLEAYYGYHSSYGGTDTKLSIQYNKKNYALIYAAQGEKFLDMLVKSSGLKLKSKDDEVKWENARVLAYYIVCDDSDVMRKYFAAQETENEKKGFLSRIINFIGNFRKKPS